MLDAAARLLSPDRVLDRSSVLARPSPVPSARGLYAWFFRETPGPVPIDSCLRWKDLKLLYVGVAPSRSTSKSNLRKRIRQHYTADAYGSTLRQTLGVLLADQSGFPIRRVGHGNRKTLTHLGEQWLDRWMDKNAFVAWVEHPAPWEVEEDVFAEIPLPLNIQGNHHHHFSRTLKHLRIEANAQARDMPIVDERGQRRRGGFQSVTVDE